MTNIIDALIEVHSIMTFMTLAIDFEGNDHIILTETHTCTHTCTRTHTQTHAARMHPPHTHEGKREREKKWKKVR